MAAASAQPSRPAGLGVRSDGRRSGVVSPAVADAIAVLVSLIWAAALVADFLVPDYSPPILVHVIAGGVIGSIFGFRIVSVTRTGDVETKGRR